MQSQGITCCNESCTKCKVAGEVCIIVLFFNRNAIMIVPHLVDAYCPPSYIIVPLYSMYLRLRISQVNVIEKFFNIKIYNFLSLSFTLLIKMLYLFRLYSQRECRILIIEFVHKKALCKSSSHVFEFYNGRNRKGNDGAAWWHTPEPENRKCLF